MPAHGSSRDSYPISVWLVANLRQECVVAGGKDYQGSQKPGVRACRPPTTRFPHPFLNPCPI